MNSKWLVALAVIFLAASACICNGELSDAASDLEESSTNVKEAVETAMAGGEESEEEAENQEAGESEIDIPEIEPEVYTCDYINTQRKRMTELQWEEYTKILVGKPIEYEGEVTEVYEDGRIQIDACSGFLSGGPFVIYGTPLDIAIKLSKDQLIKGEGTIKEVGTFIFMYIHVYGETLE